MKTLEQVCIDLECFETDEWAADAILNQELLTNTVLDPCCGPGVLSIAANKRGYHVLASDVYNYGYEDQDTQADFLDKSKFGWLSSGDFSIFMNPPFSLAEEFVERAYEMSPVKIVCFQRFAWWESGGRRKFWDKYRPVRVWVCGDRASCYRHDLPRDDKGRRYNHDGKPMSGTTTAHAFFVFKPRSPEKDTKLLRLYKSRD